jgi:hypothetical protein
MAIERYGRNFTPTNISYTNIKIPVTIYEYSYDFSTNIVRNGTISDIFLPDFLAHLITKVLDVENM